MNTKRKTLKMPVRYLMNLVLVGLLFLCVMRVSVGTYNEFLYIRF